MSLKYNRNFTQYVERVLQIFWLYLNKNLIENNKYINKVEERGILLRSRSRSIKFLRSPLALKK